MKRVEFEQKISSKDHLLRIDMRFSSRELITLTVLQTERLENGVDTE